MILASSIPHRLFPLAPILPLDYPYIVTFHLVSGDLRGGNDKKKTHEKRNIAYTLFIPIFKKAWPGQKRKKKPYFCVMFNQ